jgi:hypothetical protein
MSKRKQQIRSAFRAAVFARDNNCCRVCGVEGNLDAHHITDRHDMPHGGYVPENGVALCGQCHLSAEAGTIGFRSEDLYQLIGSSQQKAQRASANQGGAAAQSRPRPRLPRDKHRGV